MPAVAALHRRGRKGGRSGATVAFSRERDGSEDEWIEDDEAVRVRRQIERRDRAT
jgi:hypothetical protein